MKLSGCPNHSWCLPHRIPIEQEGTYPLPEAQSGPFHAESRNRLSEAGREKLIIRQNINGDKFEVQAILRQTEIIEARKVVPPGVSG